MADGVRKIEIGHQNTSGSQHAATHNEHHHEWLGGLDKTGVTLDNEDGDSNKCGRKITQQCQEQKQGLAQYESDH